MPKTEPLPDWSGHDVFIIGGGRSLRGFHFSQLADKSTIGCNQAFSLGERGCKICCFGDLHFWNRYRYPLQQFFDGWVVTNLPFPAGPSWVTSFNRIPSGLARPGERALAWNANSGGIAINLALVLGAARVYLLGFDCKCGPVRDDSHWHGDAVQIPTPEHYIRFQRGFEELNKALPVAFPNRKVLNVSNGASALTVFPIVTFEDAGLRAPPVEEMAQ